MAEEWAGIDVARRATVRICDATGRHRGQGLLLPEDVHSSVVLTCHHVIAPLIQTDIFVQIPQEDGRLSNPIKAIFDRKRSRIKHDAVVLHLAVSTSYRPALYGLNQAHASLVQAIGFSHLQPNSFNADIGPSTNLFIKSPLTYFSSDFPAEYEIPTAFRLVNPTDAREGISGSVVFSEGGVVGLVHFARGESFDTARECYLVPLSAWAKDWPELADRIKPWVPINLQSEHFPNSTRPIICVPFQAPALPTHYIERVPKIAAVLEQLLEPPSENTGVLVVSAVHGLAGIGKTALATAIAHNRQTRARFNDGVLWVVLGQEPDCLSGLVAWIQTLGDKEYRPTTVSAASTYLRTLLYEKSVLLVIDDVWHSEHAKPFLAGGRDCRALITTRRAQVADDLGAILCALDVMTPAEALSLLKKRVETGRRGSSLSGEEIAEARTLALEIGYLPFALEIMGALIARGYSWAEARRLLRLESARSPTSKSRQHHAQSKLEATLQLSLRILRREDETNWERFAWLGVLASDTVITPQLAATLWEVSEDDAGLILNSLADDAIIKRLASLEFTVHDLMHEMAQRILTSDVPNGLGLTIAQAHGLLLAKYARQIGVEEWDRLHDDSYIHSHLVWHLEQSGEKEAIHRLLGLSDTHERNAWYVARSRLGQDAGYLDDIRAAFRLNSENEGSNIARQCQYALTEASLHSLSHNISSEVLRILVNRQIWSPEKALDHIKRLRTRASRRTALQALVDSLRECPVSKTQRRGYFYNALRHAVLSETRHAVKENVKSTWWAVDTLADLAHLFDADEQNELIQEAIFMLANDIAGLQRLSKNAPASQRDRILEVAIEKSAEIVSLDERIMSLVSVISDFSSPRESKWLALLPKWTEELITKDVQSMVDKPGLVESKEPPQNTRCDPNEPQSLALMVIDYPSPLKVVSEDVPDDAYIRVIRFIAQRNFKLHAQWLTDMIERLPDAGAKTVIKGLMDAEAANQQAQDKEDVEDATSEFREALFGHPLWSDREKAIRIFPKLPAPRTSHAKDLLIGVTWPNNEACGDAATLIASSLTTEEGAEIARELVQAGRNSVGATCLLALAEPESRNKLFNSLMPKLENLTGYGEREFAMRAVARVCPGEVVKQALVSYQRLDDVSEQVAFIFSLTPALQGQLPKGILEHFGDERITGRQIATLTRLVSKLSGALQGGVLEEFIKEAAQLSSEWWIVEALTLTILRIDDNHLLNTILDAVNAIKLADLRSRIVGRIMLRLVRLGHIKDALEAVGVAPSQDRSRILADLAEELAKDDLFVEAEEVSKTIFDREERSKAYAMLALYAAARGRIEKARELANGATTDHWNDWINTRLASLNQVHQSAMTSKPSQLTSERNTAQPLKTQFSSISEAIERLREEGIESNELRQLQMMAMENNSLGVHIAAREFWRETIGGNETYLQSICRQPRHLLLKQLRQIAPLLNASLSKTEAQELVSIVRRVSTWWP